MKSKRIVWVRENCRTETYMKLTSLCTDTPSASASTHRLRTVALSVARKSQFYCSGYVRTANIDSTKPVNFQNCLIKFSSVIA